MKSNMLFKILIILLTCYAFNNMACACTIFTASSQDAVFAGNNEDMCTTNTEIHFIPAGNGAFGRVLLGFIGDENYQGGMNEYGLFFDGAGTPPVKMSPSRLPEFKGRYIMETILEQCRTVEEAIRLIKQYAQHSLRYSHNLIADATGDAAIIEWGNDQLNVIRKGDNNFLVATNFNITESKDVNNECQRYNIARDILSREQPSLAVFEKILSLMHQEGKFGTVYSNICDLKNKKLYLYNFHNFTIKREFDLTAELKKGDRKQRIRDLFPANFAEMGFRLRSDCLADFKDAPSKKVKFVIQSKVKIPEGSIAVRGSAAELGRWNDQGVALERKSDYSCTKALEIKEGTLFDFELSVDNNKYVPLDNMSQEMHETAVEVRSDTTVVLNITGWKKND